MNDQPNDHLSDEPAVPDRHDAAQLVGHSLAAIRYFNIDYSRWKLYPELSETGPRLVSSPAEWRIPTWQNSGFDAIDFGIELETTDGRIFSITWDAPGDLAGIGLREQSLIGWGLAVGAGAAVWDVTSTAGWAGLLEAPISSADLRLLPDGRSCPRLTLVAGHATVEIIMGDAKDGVLVPADDNLAVLCPPAELPAWLGAAQRY
ncbi:MAG: hypothetical protein JWR35_3189 [Marmoricola sp.]|nr:hypothetical protein [Marmoricola sp.]